MTVTMPAFFASFFLGVFATSEFVRSFALACSMPSVRLKQNHRFSVVFLLPSSPPNRLTA